MSMLGPIRQTSRRVRRPDLGAKKASPVPARPAAPARGDLPMSTFALAALVITGSVGAAALMGNAARRPVVADAPLPPPPPLVERSQAPDPERQTVAPAMTVGMDQLPVRVDREAGVIVLGYDPAELGVDDLPAPERLPIARLDEFVRSVQGDEHLRHWLELVDGRRIQIDEETARAVREVMPYRAMYDRDER